MYFSSLQSKQKPIVLILKSRVAQKTSEKKEEVITASSTVSTILAHYSLVIYIFMLVHSQLLH